MSLISCILYTLIYRLMIIGTRDIISKTIDLYRSSWRFFLPYMGGLLISTLFVSISTFFYRNGIYFLATTQGVIAITLIALLFILGQLGTILLGVALIRAIALRSLDRPLPLFSQALTDALHLLPGAIVVTLLSGIAIFFGSLLFIIPGLLLSVWLIFSLHAVSIDGQPAIHALRISKTLVKGRFFPMAWRIVAPLFVLGLFYAIPNELIVIATNQLFSLLSSQQTTAALLLALGSSLLQIILVIINIPLTTGAITLLYLDAKRTM